MHLNFAARTAATNSSRGTLTGLRGATRDLPITKQQRTSLSSYKTRKYEHAP